MERSDFLEALKNQRAHIMDSFLQTNKFCTLKTRFKICFFKIFHSNLDNVRKYNDKIWLLGTSICSRLNFDQVPSAKPLTCSVCGGEQFFTEKWKNSV